MIAFEAFDICDGKCFTYILDSDIHPDAMGLGNIKPSKNEFAQERIKTVIFLHHHISL